MLADRKQPEAGETWRHWKGGCYKILSVARSAWEQYPLMIVAYQSLETEEVWWRPLPDFMAVKSADEGTNFYRFERVI
jgi:hypothetical protein